MFWRSGLVLAVAIALWIGTTLQYAEGPWWLLATVPLVIGAALAFWSCSPFPPDASRLGVITFVVLVAVSVLGPEGGWKAAAFALVFGAMAGGGLRSNLRFYT